MQDDPWNPDQGFEPYGGGQDVTPPTSPKEGDGSGGPDEPEGPVFQPEDIDDLRPMTPDSMAGSIDEPEFSDIMPNEVRERIDSLQRERDSLWEELDETVQELKEAKNSQEFLQNTIRRMEKELQNLHGGGEPGESAGPDPALAAKLAEAEATIDTLRGELKGLQAAEATINKLQEELKLLKGKPQPGGADPKQLKRLQESMGTQSAILSKVLQKDTALVLTVVKELNITKDELKKLI